MVTDAEDLVRLHSPSLDKRDQADISELLNLLTRRRQITLEQGALKLVEFAQMFQDQTDDYIDEEYDRGGNGGIKFIRKPRNEN